MRFNFFGSDKNHLELNSGLKMRQLKPNLITYLMLFLSFWNPNALLDPLLRFVKRNQTFLKEIGFQVLKPI